MCRAEKIAQRANARGQLSRRRLPDHLHQINAQSSLVPFPSLGPSSPGCQICGEVASGQGAQNGSCSRELGQQTQKANQASLVPRSQSASQLPVLCVHSHTRAYTHTHTTRTLTRGQARILIAPCKSQSRQFQLRAWESL